MALRSTVLARIAMYFNFIMRCYFVFLRIFKKNSRWIAVLIMVVLFLAYMIMLLPTDSNLLPYRTIFGQIFIRRGMKNNGILIVIRTVGKLEKNIKNYWIVSKS